LSGAVRRKEKRERTERNNNNRRPERKTREEARAEMSPSLQRVAYVGRRRGPKMY